MHATGSSHHDPADEGLLVALFTVVRRLKARVGHESPDAPTMWVLHQVQCHSEVRLSDLATAVGLDASTVSRHVQALEKSGHVTRTGDPDDRRASRISLTERGADVLRDAFDSRLVALDAALAGWSAHDRSTLDRLVSRLADDLAHEPQHGTDAHATSKVQETA